jgi:nitrogen fixation/metabolism regulation signal transduction histidine kinase
MVNSFKEISDNMILEYSLIGSSADLIESYNGLIKEIDSKEKITKYNKIHKKIEETYSKLDETIIYDESKIAYLGLKNSVNDMINECDEGLKAAVQGNYSEISTRYDEANKIYYFVRENTANLLLKELDYAEQIEGDIVKVQTIVGIVISVLVLVIVTSCVFYSFKFSEKLIFPLSRLTELAKKIAGGKMDLTVEKQLIDQKDEIGSLSNSFNLMVQNLKDKVNESEKARKEIEKINTEIINKSKELERMNKLMVGRELKMAEMKKEMEELKKKQPS